MGKATARGSETNSRQFGAMLPILAVISLAVITALLILSLFVISIKSRGAELRKETERICRFIGLKPWNYDYGVRTFQREVDNLNIAGFEIQWARLIMPTMPDEGSATWWTTCAPGNTCTLASPPTTPGILNDGDHRFQNLQLPATGGGVVRCNSVVGGAGDCLFDWDLDNLDGVGGPERYPARFWYNGYHSGNTVGCEIRGEITNVLTRLFPGLDREIGAKVVWSATAAGTRSAPAAVNQVFNASPGLSIGVATEMSTWAGDSAFGTPNSNSVGDFRFRFDGAFEIAPGVPIYSAGVPAVFDPLRLRGPTGSQVPAGFLFQNPTLNISGSVIAPSITNPTAGAERDEALLACQNPAVLARNLFVGTIAELASRHGQFRNRTRISHVNPKHWNYGNPAAVPVATGPNRPTLIVNFGQDLRAKAYGLPFVFYDSGNDSSLPLPPLRKNGLIRAETLTSTHHAVISGQLRNCLHLYHDISAGSTIRTGIEIPATSTLATPNFSFENQPLYAPAEVARPSYLNNSPWGCQTTAACERINAIEAVAMLGTTQACPRGFGTTDATFPGGGVGTGYPTGGCPKRYLPLPLVTEELLPDTEGYLSFEAAAIDPTLGGSSIFKAFNFPGVFPLSGSATAAAPFGALSNNAFYTEHNTNRDPDSTVLLITHSIVSGPSSDPIATAERTRLRTLVNALNARNRAVKVVVFPTEFSPTFDADVKLFCQNVLGLLITCLPDPAPAAAARRGNQFVLFSPWNTAAYQNRYTGAPYRVPANQQETILARYWADLVQFEPAKPDDEFIVTAAEEFFENSLVRHEPKL